MIEFGFANWKQWTPKVNIWLLMKNEQSLVKRQIERSNELGVRWICYPQKADENRNPKKQKSSDLELQSERYPIFKISNFLD